MFVNIFRNNLWHHILEIFKEQFKTDAGFRGLAPLQLSKKSKSNYDDIHNKEVQDNLGLVLNHAIPKISP
ncbi:MAG: hypothetical protein AMJ79_03060 [Phycisphaerae bacterium SM23_30]|nr:MAG: hypothetical protein AMJ79_03060 [Phycisphaerae bacterium SM23_30]